MGLETEVVDSLLGGQAPQKPSTPSVADGVVDNLLGGKPNDPDRFAKNVQKIPEDFKGSADFATLTKASIVEDPQTKLRIFAKGRFPKLPEKEALSRYGIIDGEVYYLDDDGNIKGETASGIKNFAANMVGQAPVMAGGVAGSVLGAPSGPAGMLAGGALGAAGAKGYMQTAANLAFDEPQSVKGNIEGMAKEALFETGGNLLGMAFAKALTAGKARDIAKLNTANVADIDKKAAKIGVDLNVAQRTNLPSIKSKYDVVASMPTSRDIIGEHAERQANQAYKAADDFISKVSKVADVDEAGAQARDAAKTVIAKLTQERAAQASPLYKKAFEEFQGIPPEFMPAVKELSERPSMKQAARLASRIANDEGIILENPQNSLQGMHYIKLALDKMIGDDARGGFAKTSRGALIGIKRELVEMMDEFSPTYKEARAVFAHLTPNIISVQDGIISRVAGLKDEQALEASKLVFADGRSPAAVERMRNLFLKSGLEEDWNALLASHLRETFSKAGQEYATSGGQLMQAPKWRAALVGNPRQYRLMEKAMSTPQFTAFNDMMDVFDAMSRTAAAGKGSQTAGRLEGMKSLYRDSGAGVMGQGAGLFSPQNWGTRAMEWLQEVRVGNHAEKLAEIMTSKDAMKKLRDLKRLSPNDQKFIAGASSLFGISLKPANKPADTSPEQGTSQ
jgi:hypothetical protein